MPLPRRQRKDQHPQLLQEGLRGRDLAENAGAARERGGETPVPGRRPGAARRARGPAPAARRPRAAASSPLRSSASPAVPITPATPEAGSARLVERGSSEQGRVATTWPAGRPAQVGGDLRRAREQEAVPPDRGPLRQPHDERAAKARASGSPSSRSRSTRLCRWTTDGVVVPRSHHAVSACSRWRTSKAGAARRRAGRAAPPRAPRGVGAGRASSAARPAAPRPARPAIPAARRPGSTARPPPRARRHRGRRGLGGGRSRACPGAPPWAAAARRARREPSRPPAHRAGPGTPALHHTRRTLARFRGGNRPREVPPRSVCPCDGLAPTRRAAVRAARSGRSRPRRRRTRSTFADAPVATPGGSLGALVLRVSGEPELLDAHGAGLPAGAAGAEALAVRLRRLGAELRWGAPEVVPTSAALLGLVRGWGRSSLGSSAPTPACCPSSRSAAGWASRSPPAPAARSSARRPLRSRGAVPICSRSPPAPPSGAASAPLRRLPVASAAERVHRAASTTAWPAS